MVCEYGNALAFGVRPFGKGKGGVLLLKFVLVLSSEAWGESKTSRLVIHKYAFSDHCHIHD